ncbi:tail fiber domain-containing protein [Runella sp. SP2]|uniref:tail fiber domain-containing protein n=1 Tax=Runella sp. SP2 TaxID=2268026 RepID=UPI0013DDB385|nr:tail fiber domain-containing protein [Runella sp. SP2]
MKTSFTLLLMAWGIVVSNGLTYAQSTEIRPGVILPQMTTAQRTALSATNGMLVFDTNTQSYWLRSNNTWTELPKTASSTSYWEQSGAAGNEIRNTNSGGFWSANSTAVTTSNPATAPVSGAGTRLMWIPSRSAFRVGTVDGTQWNTSNIGLFSTAIGSNTTAIGSYATAIGNNTTASGYASTAMGFSAVANGSSSVAMGFEARADGNVSTAMGGGTVATGDNSTAMGFANVDDPNGLLMLGNGVNSVQRKTVLVVRRDNSMGLGDFGAATNTLATLHVNTYKNVSTGRVTVLYPTIATPSNFPTSTAELSIYASQGIFSATYIGSAQNVVLSDARIKEVEGTSDNAQDLATLRRLRITDYRMKDRYVWGDRAFKKVIAQQVEEVYPQAVRRQTSFIPDIYQAASLENGFVKLAGHTLKAGERVKLMMDNREEITEVLETNETGFRIGGSVPSTTVFVYGREVSDFRTVDYEALSMLGISAIQQLAKENDTLKKDSEELKNRLSRLEALVENLATAEATTKTGK